MKRRLFQLTASLLSAVMLCTAVPGEAMTAAAATSAEETFRQMVRDAWSKRQDQLKISSLRLSFDEVADVYYGTLYTDSEWFYVSSSFTYVKRRVE